MLAAASALTVPETADPLVSVVIVCPGTPLVPLKTNGPTPPIDVLVTWMVGSLLFVNVQVIVCAWPFADAPVTDCGMVIDGADAVPPTVTAVPAAFVHADVVE